MSFEKQYPNRKDKRKPYRGSKRHDRSCRNHGSCSYCQSNRHIAEAKERERVAVVDDPLHPYDDPAI